MPNTADDQFDRRTFVTLRPDRLVQEREERSAFRLDLNAQFAGPVPYMTLQLAEGVEMHCDPASRDETNHVATGLAEALGFTDTTIQGTVRLTGDSAETDRAQGMDLQAYDALFECLAEVCSTQGTRLWRQYRPGDTVMVRPADYASGDDLWFGGQPHRFLRMVDYPADSVTAETFPGVQYFQCVDGFEMGASGASYPEKAEHAPSGYWQRTGNQLLPDQN
ncbi:hypothetical protein ACFC7A_26910 [Streptomyces niveus]|uniref:hypothetical protein n=1 Tax=Streptomyces niveus TaxID=193462 RepID=UPI0035DCD5CA